MNENPNLADEDRGLYPKYRALEISDVDFTSDVDVPIKVGGFPIKEVTEPFFLLKFNDPYAAAALRAYARECSFKYPKLAEDIVAKLRDTRMGLDADLQSEIDNLRAKHKKVDE